MEENKNYSSTTNIDKNQLFKNASSAVDVLKDPLPKIGRFDERCNLRENEVLHNDINYGGSTSSFGDVKEKFKHNFELIKESGDGISPRDCIKNKCQKSNNNNLKSAGSHDLESIVSENENTSKKNQAKFNTSSIVDLDDLNSSYLVKPSKEAVLPNSERRNLPISHSRNISQLEPYYDNNKAHSYPDYENFVHSKYDQNICYDKLAYKCNVDYEPSSSEISIDDFCNVTSLSDNINTSAGLSGKFLKLSLLISEVT